MFPEAQLFVYAFLANVEQKIADLRPAWVYCWKASPALPAEKTNECIKGRKGSRKGMGSPSTCCAKDIANHLQLTVFKSVMVSTSLEALPNMEKISLYLQYKPTFCPQNSVSFLLSSYKSP